MYINIRLQVRMIQPLIEKRVYSDKPGLLDPSIGRIREWLRGRILFAGGKGIIL
jgi:hypothetical protein